MRSAKYNLKEPSNFHWQYIPIVVVAFFLLVTFYGRSSSPSLVTTNNPPTIAKGSHHPLRSLSSNQQPTHQPQYVHKHHSASPPPHHQHPPGSLSKSGFHSEPPSGNAPSPSSSPSSSSQTPSPSPSPSPANHQHHHNEELKLLVNSQNGALNAIQKAVEMAVSALEVRMDNEVANLQLQISQQGALLNDLNTGMMVFEKGAFGDFLPHTRQRLGMNPIASPSSDDQSQPASMPSQIGLLKAQVYDLGLGVNGLRDELAKLVKRLSEMEQGFFALRSDANRDLQSVFTQVNALRDSIVAGLGIVESHLSMEKDALSLASFPPSLTYTPSSSSNEGVAYTQQQQQASYQQQQQQQQQYQQPQAQTTETTTTTNSYSNSNSKPSTHSLTTQQLQDLVQLQEMELEALKAQHEEKEREKERENEKKDKEERKQAFSHRPDPELPGAEEEDDPLVAKALLTRMQSALLKDHLQHEHSKDGGHDPDHPDDHDIDVSINTGGKVRKASIATDHQHHGHDHTTTPTTSTDPARLTALDMERQRQEASDHERAEKGEADHEPPVIQVISGFRSLKPLPPMVDV